MKKSYTTPEMTELGKVTKLTRGGRKHGGWFQWFTFNWNQYFQGTQWGGFWNRIGSCNYSPS